MEGVREQPASEDSVEESLIARSEGFHKAGQIEALNDFAQLLFRVSRMHTVTVSDFLTAE